MQVLSKFFEKIKINPKASHVKDVVNGLSNKDLKQIYFEVYNITNTKQLSELDVCIVHTSIKLLLEKWKGYYKVQDKNKMLKDLLEFLKENLDYIKETVNEKVAECAKSTTTLEKINSSTTPERVGAITTAEKENTNTTLERVNANATAENVIKLMCPYIKLKSAFYSKLHPTENSLINCYQALNKYCKMSYIYKMSELVNWPDIEIKLHLSNLVISRQNMNKSEFKLVSLRHNFIMNIHAKSTELQYHEKQGCENVSFPGEFILAFFKQLKREISPLAYASRLKESVLSILSAFEKDASLCTEEINTNTEYYYNLNRYPYVRFLAQKPGDNRSCPIIRHRDQISLDENSENIRLQQVFSPYVKFILSAFNVTYDLDKNLAYVFSIPRNLIHGLFILGCVSFRCCLCNFQCVGLHSEETLKKHLNSIHSVEPDWCCPLCEKGFTTQYLTANCWKHHCKKLNQ